MHLPITATASTLRLHLLLVLLLLLPALQGLCHGWSWMVAGNLNPLVPPPCQSYCLNVPANIIQENANVTLFGCTGTIYNNEQWTYNNSTQQLSVVSISGDRFCLDVPNLDINSRSLVRLLKCNSKSKTQRWIFQPNSMVRNGGNDNKTDASQPSIYLQASVNSSDLGNIVPGGFPLYVANVSLASSVKDFTLVDSSVVETFIPQALPISDSSNLIVNSYLQPSYTAVQGVALPAPFEYLDNRDQKEFLFYVCDWQIRGPITYFKMTGMKACPFPTCNNVTVVDLNKDQQLLSPIRGSVSQTVPTFKGASYDIFITVGRNLSGCDSSKKTFVRISAIISDSSVSSATNNFNLSANGPDWEVFRFIFVANSRSANLTILSETSLAGCGPLISSVQMYLSSYDPPLTNRNRNSVEKPAEIAMVFGWSLAAVGVVSIILQFFALTRQKKRITAMSNPLTISRRVNAVKYSMKDIRSFTENFKILLGKGGFADVYWGSLSDGTPIAVKRGIKSVAGKTGDDFYRWAEVSMLSRVHHRCIIDFLGYCDDQGEMMLVFEYMPNGSLYGLLHGESRVPLSWSQRMRIACQVAYALEYLHHGANPPTLHRDIKSANILVAEDLSAKLADLGLSKTGDIDASRFSSTMTIVKGSFGYIDPQYFQTSIISEKSDVYSFGVVLLELISGRKAMQDFETLAVWFQRMVDTEDNIEKLLDPRLGDSVSLTQLRTVVEVAGACVRANGQTRPSMLEVMKLLQSCFDGDFNSEQRPATDVHTTIW